MEKDLQKELWDRDNREIVPNQQEFQINGQKIPDPKSHQTISFIKSGIRILSCLIGLLGFYEYGFLGLLIAEIVGIYEELV